MTGRNSAVSAASPPKPPSKSSRNAPHPTTRKRPRETLRPFAPRTQTFGVSGCRRCLAANLVEVDHKEIARRNTQALVTPPERADYHLATPLWRPLHIG